MKLTKKPVESAGNIGVYVIDLKPSEYPYLTILLARNYFNFWFMEDSNLLTSSLNKVIEKMKNWGEDYQRLYEIDTWVPFITCARLISNISGKWFEFDRYIGKEILAGVAPYSQKLIFKYGDKST